MGGKTGAASSSLGSGYMGTCIAGWYLCSSISNNASKSLLGVFPYPLTIAIAQYVPVIVCVPLYKRLFGEEEKKEEPLPPLTPSPTSVNRKVAGIGKSLSYELSSMEEGTVNGRKPGTYYTSGPEQRSLGVSNGNCKSVSTEVELSYGHTNSNSSPSDETPADGEKHAVPVGQRMDGSDLLSVVLCHWRFCLFIGFASMMAHVLQRTSLLYVPVSFSHTVKACQPFFMCFISYFWMKERLPWRAYVSLLPIAIGISLATVNEIHFNLLGAVAAVGSALALTIAHISSKILIKEPGMDKYNVYYLANIGSFLTCFPLWLFREGFSVLGPLVMSRRMVLLLMASSFTVALQQFLSLTILQVMTPTSHGVVNSFKRIFVIVASIVVFGNEIGAWNGMGIAMSILGGYLYQRAMKLAKLEKNKDQLQEV